MWPLREGCIITTQKWSVATCYCSTLWTACLSLEFASFNNSINVNVHQKMLSVLIRAKQMCICVTVESNSFFTCFNSFGRHWASGTGFTEWSECWTMTVTVQKQTYKEHELHNWNWSNSLLRCFISCSHWEALCRLKLSYSLDSCSSCDWSRLTSSVTLLNCIWSCLSLSVACSNSSCSTAAVSLACFSCWSSFSGSSSKHFTFGNGSSVLVQHAKGN